MIEIQSNWENLIIKNSENKKIEFNYSNKEVKIDWFLIDFPWEYEKAWILLEVKEHENNFFYNFSIDWNALLLIPEDNFELKEEIVSFFGDVDVLLINWTKNSPKIIENVEARVVVPFWEWKDVCLNALWQHKEEVENIKLKSSDFENDETQIINLKM